jgi:hypothetical protein
MQGYENITATALDAVETEYRNSFNLLDILRAQDLLSEEAFQKDVRKLNADTARKRIEAGQSDLDRRLKNIAAVNRAEQGLAVKQAEILQEEARAQGNYFGFVISGFQGLAAEMDSVWDGIARSQRDVVGAMSRSLAGGLFDFFKSGVLDMKKVWQGFVDDVLRSISRLLADAAVKQLGSLLFGAQPTGGEFNLGGLLGLAGSGIVSGGQFLGGLLGDFFGGGGGADIATTTLGDAASDALLDGGLQFLQTGGVVAGSLNAPRLVVAHGGEVVLTPAHIKLLIEAIRRLSMFNVLAAGGSFPGGDGGGASAGGRAGTTEGSLTSGNPFGGDPALAAAIANALSTPLGSLGFQTAVKAVGLALPIPGLNVLGFLAKQIAISEIRTSLGSLGINPGTGIPHGLGLMSTATANAFGLAAGIAEGISEQDVTSIATGLGLAAGIAEGISENDVATAVGEAAAAAAAAAADAAGDGPPGGGPGGGPGAGDTGSAADGPGTGDSGDSGDSGDGDGGGDGGDGDGGFAHGGIVPGPRGQRRRITAHGGELVLPEPMVEEFAEGMERGGMERGGLGESPIIIHNVLKLDGRVIWENNVKHMRRMRNAGGRIIPAEIIYPSDRS